MTGTVRVAADEFVGNFARYRGQAAGGDIVEVTDSGKVVGGFISAAELQRFEDLKARERKVWKLDDLPDDLLADIEAAEYGKISE